MSMSNPRTLRAGLNILSDAIKAQSSATHKKTSSLLSRFSNNPHHSPASTTAGAGGVSSPTSPIDSSSPPHPHPGSPTSPRRSSTPIPPSTTTSPHHVHHRPTPSSSSGHNKPQMVSIYDKPAWSSEPREQSMRDLAASESPSLSFSRPGGGTTSNGARRTTVTIHTYDGPSCPYP